MNYAVLGALSALIAVLAGAFGAHALEHAISGDLLRAFETGLRYQMFHALALLILGLNDSAGGPVRWSRPGALFVLGTVLFSGSLYALALTGQRQWGLVTPIGGLCLLLGWAMLAARLWRGRPAAA